VVKRIDNFIILIPHNQKKVTMPFFTFIKTHSIEQDRLNLYTVGYYNAKGEWEPESDHFDIDNAIKRVTHLNNDWKNEYKEKICQWEFWRVVRQEYQQSPNILDNYYHALFFAAIRLSDAEALLLEAAYPGLANVIECYKADNLKR
jgi:hypothetical protein